MFQNEFNWIGVVCFGISLELGRKNLEAMNGKSVEDEWWIPAGGKWKIGAIWSISSICETHECEDQHPQMNKACCLECVPNIMCYRLFLTSKFRYSPTTIVEGFHVHFYSFNMFHAFWVNQMSRIVSMLKIYDSNK